MKTMLAVIMLIMTVDAVATDWTWAPDLPEGSELPSFRAVNSDGEPISSEQLSGDNGMLLLFNRSTVW